MTALSTILKTSAHVSQAIRSATSATVRELPQLQERQRAALLAHVRKGIETRPREGILAVSAVRVLLLVIHAFEGLRKEPFEIRLPPGPNGVVIMELLVNECASPVVPAATTRLGRCHRVLLRRQSCPSARCSSAHRASAADAEPGSTSIQPRSCIRNLSLICVKSAADFDLHHLCHRGPGGSRCYDKARLECTTWSTASAARSLAPGPPSRLRTSAILPIMRCR